MKQIEFASWLKQMSYNQKVCSDHISRLRRLERVLSIDIDEEFRVDQCKHLLSIFKNAGKNAAMEAYGDIDLPVGKYYICTYKCTLNKYINFLKSSS